MRVSTSLQRMTFKERPSELVLLRARNRRLNTINSLQEHKRLLQKEKG